MRTTCEVTGGREGAGSEVRGNTSGWRLGARGRQEVLEAILLLSPARVNPRQCRRACDQRCAREGERKEGMSVPFTGRTLPH